MKTEDFSFVLPQELIAQTPLQNRDESRLMVVSKEDGRIFHRQFKDLIDYIDEKDVLVLNNSKVLPARLYGQREGTSGKVEFLLLEKIGEDLWRCLAKPGKKLKVGAKVFFAEGFSGKVSAVEEDGIRRVQFDYEGNFEDLLECHAEMPLPPYIHEKLRDQKRYQTIYAKTQGSAAAPTAGLHFTQDLLQKIREKNIAIAYVTLHVGLGTFRPVKVKEVEQHKMHEEFYDLDEENAAIIRRAKAKGGRIFAVGTTTTRTLETIFRDRGDIVAQRGRTDIFIYPGYSFGAVDALLTNFHLPESTLIMLVSALLGQHNTLLAYEEAVKARYRFFSFGDAMLIV